VYLGSLLFQSLTQTTVLPCTVGGAIFIIAEQFVIVDMAYNWNDSWVTKSNEAEAEEPGSGQKWLVAILMACGVFYIFAIGIVIYMFIEFTGCASNETFIALTILFCVCIHAAQLSGEEGSLLSSSLFSAWACFLCYTAVSRNPNEECNPRLGEVEVPTIVLGLMVTFVSLGWAGWAYTAEDMLTVKPGGEETPQEPTTAEQGEPGERQKISGVVMGDYYGTSGSGEEEMPGGNDPAKFSNSWRLNIVLAAVACWKSMILTQWGEIAGDGTVANSSAGRISMWMVIASQWLSLSLYLWTLVAPRLFPDRDFN
jgi:hypothetical protein